MTRLVFQNHAIHVPLRLSHGGRELFLENVVVDTGSWGSVFGYDALARIGVVQEEGDPVETVRGIGGTEAVVLKVVDRITVGDISAQDVEIELGSLAYGFPLDGILGLEFLMRANVVIDLPRLILRMGGAG